MFAFPCLLLIACGSPPAQEGLWHITIDNLQSNTCEAAGIDDAAIGVGEAITVTLALSDDGNSFTTQADGGDANSYTLSGDSFSRTDSQSAVVADPCYLREDIAIDGRFTSDSFATSSVGDDLSTEGDCSGVDTTGLPCSYEAEVSWEYVGD